MELNPETRVMELIEEYPLMFDFLSIISLKLRRIRILAQGEKKGEKASPEVASIAEGLTVARYLVAECNKVHL